MTPQDALFLDRLLADASLSVVWGGGGLAWLAADAARARLLTIMRLPLFACGSFGALAGIAALPVQTAAIASDWRSALQADVLATVALHTNVGFSTSVEAATSLALLGTVVMGYGRMAIALACVALCETATRGHAAAAFDLTGAARIAVDAVHVLSATAWVGALIPFILLVRLTNSPDLRPAAVTSMRRFSRIGHSVVALVLLSGAANTLLILGHLPLDPSSPYQAKLLLKVGIALAMTCLAVVNRYLVVPLHRGHPVLSGRLLMLGASTEIAFGALAFALVAFFGLEDPTA